VTFRQAHKTNYTPGRETAIIKLVLHYTAGDGDTAEGNANYFAGANRNASVHYFVDEDSVVQTVLDTDIAWHAGDWETNKCSIGIEMCSRKDKSGVYYIPDKTINNAQYLVKQLMKKYGIPLNNVIRHYDVTGKKCPAPMVDEAKWEAFKAGCVEHCPVDPCAEWACEAWQTAADKGVLDGKRPYDSVTRQELAVILSRLGLLN
jgi:N-acetylmuramoyl-L-alanine amidase